MASKGFLCLGCAAVVAASVMATTTSAQPADKRTYFTFSGPVSVPGVTLPPGKYMFRLVDTTTRSVVQVLSGDGMKHYTLFITIGAERTEPSDDPEIRFMESAAGTPAAVKSWWYPGERRGWEFVYPKRQARLLARGTGQPVLTTQTETATAQETRAADLARITPAGEQTEFEQGPSMPAGPVLKGEIAPPAVPVQEPEQTLQALPATASAAPLIALAGVLLIIGVVALRSWRIARR